MGDGGDSSTESDYSSQGSLEPEAYEGGDEYHLTAKRMHMERKSDFGAEDEHARSTSPRGVLPLCCGADAPWMSEPLVCNRVLGEQE